ncbi:cytochrome P450 [Luteimonas sp. JM171]|uniref:cytochrome P450 n=1 Tax=Luteimonas sp. JM171 TaxID=1896164 RepID=UPI0012FCD00D|nr:cytochrome P450 [Luteimonas sp. JM171]
MAKFSATPSMEDILRRRKEEGPIFWLAEDILAVFDASVAQRVDAANFADLTMLDSFTDTLLGRSSEAVDWRQLRSAWGRQMRTLTNAEHLQLLTERMEVSLREKGAARQDLVWLVENVITGALVPSIIAGLPNKANNRIVREIKSKISFVFSDVDPPRSPRWQALIMSLRQVLAGIEVRRELSGRVNGSRRRQKDLADPVVDMIPSLGIGRAVDAVTALLTAITGSPGAVAACLLYELTRRPEWYARLQVELGSISAEKLYGSPVQSAPETTRFVKETLRIWSSPSVLVRNVRVPIAEGEIRLKPGHRYVMSPYIVHNDPERWRNPDQFDPDRWVSEKSRPANCAHEPYMPFGWAPKSCVGASLGLAQLILLSHLLCTKFRISVDRDSPGAMMIASVVRPTGFFGSIVPV